MKNLQRWLRLSRLIPIFTLTVGLVAGFIAVVQEVTNTPPEQQININGLILATLALLAAIPSRKPTRPFSNASSKMAVTFAC